MSGSTSLPNLLGIITILSWGALGLLGKFASAMPPFFVLSVCFLSVSVMGIIYVMFKNSIQFEIVWKQSLLSGAFLYLYHFLYFEAFHHASAIGVSLINYLWPALVILLGNLFFALGAGLRGYLAAALGFIGIAFLLGGDIGIGANQDSILGYGLAFAGAVVWATYCNLRRESSGDPTANIMAVCLVAGLLAATSSIAFDEIPSMSDQDIVVLACLTIGPAGGVFFLWDYAMRYGNAAMLAVFGYSAPVISTLLLIATGYAPLAENVLVATFFVALGGLVSSKSPSGKPKSDVKASQY